jgi:1,5-anhydro-D-fructose reductase (1,5-anhydro-D-mannitol-forming)
MKWALLGASDIAATQVIPALRTCGQDVVTVMSSTSGRASDFAASHQIPNSTTDLNEALQEVDAAYVSSTNEKHFEQVTAALDHGLHVLCEKPLAIDAESARAMVRHANRSRLVLAINHHLRNSPVLRSMRELISQGEIGELLSVRVDHAVSLPERLRGWRLDDKAAGGGVVLDLTVHDIDTIRFVTRLEPTSIVAVGVSQGLGRTVEDAVMTAGTLGERVIFSTHDAFTVSHNVTSMQVHGTTGSLVGLDCLTPVPVGVLELRRERAVEQISTPPVDSLYAPAIEAFVASAAGHGQPVASGDDGRRALETALGALTSLEHGSRVQLFLDMDVEAA